MKRKGWYWFVDLFWMWRSRPSLSVLRTFHIMFGVFRKGFLVDIIRFASTLYSVKTIGCHLYASSPERVCRKIDGLVEVLLLEVILRKKHDSTFLSTFVQSYFHIEYQFNVSRYCFSPPPSVESAVITMKPNPSVSPACIANPQKYQSFLRACFRSKNQSLRKNLKRWNESVQTDLSCRPWELSSEEYMKLFS